MEQTEKKAEIRGVLTAVAMATISIQAGGPRSEFSGWAAVNIRAEGSQGESRERMKSSWWIT